MQTGEKKKSAALERRVQCYPPPAYHRLICAHSKVDQISESQIVSQALKEFYDRMPPQEKQRILTQSKHCY